ncbi:MAG: hypothetical protein L0I53_06175 [Lactiplantibacillus plantarum]|nr:hypothetical protein [Lactiplantibacillus plantarum]
MEDMPSRSEMHREKSQGNNSQGNGNGPKKKHPVRNTVLIIIAVLPGPLPRELILTPRMRPTPSSRVVVLKRVGIRAPY